MEWTRKKKQKQDVQQYAAFLPECTVQTLWLARDPTADRTVPRRRCLTYTSTCISNVMARFVKKQAHHWRSIIACCTNLTPYQVVASTIFSHGAFVILNHQPWSAQRLRTTPCSKVHPGASFEPTFVTSRSILVKFFQNM